MAPAIADDAALPVYEQERRWPRHKIDVPVRAVLNKPDRILDGRGMEMSEGGICLLMDAELGLGDKIELEFTPPYSGKPIRVRSEVCNRTEYRYGVKFIPEGKEERSEVARLRQILNPFEEAAHGSVGSKRSSSAAAPSIATILIGLALCVSAAVAQSPAQAPLIKDPAEYNAYVTAVQQKDIAAQISRLEAFLTQYPNSIMKVAALQSIMQDYQQTNNQQKTP